VDDDMVTAHVPTTVSFETDRRRVFGLRDDEIAVKFTRVFDVSHTEHQVIRMTRDEIRDAYRAFENYLAGNDG
jgi:hypothetical protein